VKCQNAQTRNRWGSLSSPKAITAPHTLDLPMSRATKTVDLALAVGICLLLAFGPLAFGAVQEWSTFVLEVGTAICIALWTLREITKPQLEIIFNPLFVPILLFAALIGAQLLLNLSAYWYVTWRKALLWAAYAMLFFLVTQCFRSTASLKRFGQFFTAYGFLLALFAIIQQFTWNGKIYWVVPNRNGGWVYGPYVNHAHYAGLMVLLVPIPLVFSIAGFSRKPARVLFAFAALIMASTIFLSQSLGGIVSFAAELLVFGVLTTLGQRSHRHVYLLGVACIVLAGWLIILSPGGLGRRLAELHHPQNMGAAGDRIAIMKDSFKMVRERPILGWGFGTFSVVYPSFRSFYSNFVVNEAHNDYVQILVETGVVGFAIAIAFVGLVYRISLRGIEHWRSEPRAGIALAALVGFSGLLVHSLCDFNLQIPANAALFFVLAAIATGSGTFKRSISRFTPYETRRTWESY